MKDIYVEVPILIMNRGSTTVYAKRFVNQINSVPKRVVALPWEICCVRPLFLVTLLFGSVFVRLRVSLPCLFSWSLRWQTRRIQDYRSFTLCESFPLLRCLNVLSRSDPSIINLLSETESCDFEKTIEKAEIEIKANKMKAEASTSARTEEISNASKLISVDESERINICNDADWCELSLFRLKAVASDFRPCYLNFPFHIAAITNKMLNIYEDEEETDLHDFLR